MSDWYVANLAAVAHEAFEEETVLINFERGTYFSLRQSAPAIWAMLQTPVTPAAILDALAAACGPLPAEAPAAVAAMLDRLCAEGCLLRSEAGAAAAAPAAPGGAFALPVIEAFHDLSELIAIDPVHDTHEFTGWPHRPPAYALEE